MKQSTAQMLISLVFFFAFIGCIIGAIALLMASFQEAWYGQDARATFHLIWSIIVSGLCILFAKVAFADEGNK